ncbi:hypothetical protein ACLOJK_021854 [Asimina triloba]
MSSHPRDLYRGHFFQLIHIGHADPNRLHVWILCDLNHAEKHIADLEEQPAAAILGDLGDSRRPRTTTTIDSCRPQIIDGQLARAVGSFLRHKTQADPSREHYCRNAIMKAVRDAFSVRQWKNLLAGLE